MAKLSTGLRDHVLAGGSFKDAMDGGVIFVYAGPVPASADADLAGNTLLVVLSNDATGTGVNFAGAPASGVLGKDSGEIWRGQITATGTPTFFRHAQPADDGSSSTTAIRVQGTVGVLSADMLVGNTNFVAGDYRQIDSYNVGMPTE